MNALCLFVAGALQATLPTTDVTLQWVHSIEKTRWQERYRVEGRQLKLVEARIEGSGAGMDPGPDARLIDGWWTWRPNATLSALHLTLSPFTRDYDLCWRGRCHTLRSLATQARPAAQPLLPRDEAANDVAFVELRACNRKEHE
ncbi:MAG TPA: DUF1850 domain-containing protein [Casimicrobiaceae bacterium]|nr:DUF1850 domain-containing protein [Casimicrobiaceae bacterium]